MEQADRSPLRRDLGQRCRKAACSGRFRRRAAVVQGAKEADPAGRVRCVRQGRHGVARSLHCERRAHRRVSRMGLDVLAVRFRLHRLGHGQGCLGRADPEGPDPRRRETVTRTNPGGTAASSNAYIILAKEPTMDRREFLGAAAALTATAAYGGSPAPLPRRPYKNGIDLSIIALGGIVVCGLSQEEASRRVAAAYDRGVNYFDCAPSYFNGEAETKLGEALRPYRSKVFLAEKTMHRDAKGAREELERSLQRFHTDHVDLYQFHAVSSMDDVDRILAAGGAAETFFAARKEGKALHLGFSAHNAPAALRLM